MCSSLSFESSKLLLFSALWAAAYHSILWLPTRCLAAMQYRRSSAHSTPIAASCSGNDCRCLQRPGIIRPAQSRPMILLSHYLLNECFLYVGRADLVGTCLAGFAPCVLQLQNRRFGHFLFRQPRRLLQCPEQCLAGCIHKREALLSWPALLKGTRQATQIAITCKCQGSLAVCEAGAQFEQLITKVQALQAARPVAGAGGKRCGIA